MDTVLFLGLGRIGLPQSLVFANKGFRVYGFDIDSHLIETLNQRKTPFNEPKMEEYLKKNIQKTFFPISSWDKLSESFPEVSTVFFTLGTKALNAEQAITENEFDLSGHITLLDQLFPGKSHFPKKVKLIIRTTLPLGGTDRLRRHLEEKNAIQEGKDFYFSFVPERIVVGSAIHEEETLPKIIGSYSDDSFNAIKKIFEKIGGPIVRVKNPITAEFCKLTDNSFRNTLFAYSNEIALHAAQNGVDVIEVIDAVNDHYSRNKIPKPGFVSGYCLGKDPYIFEIDFLSRLKNQQRDFHSLWYYGRKTNDYLTLYSALKIISHLKDANEGIVAVLGLSFKEDVDDFRMSDSLDIIKQLIRLNIKKFKVYDPNLEMDKYTLIPENLKPYILHKTSDIQDVNLFTDVTSIIICHKYHNLLDMNDEKKLSSLLKNVKKPCYLLDACNIWREAENLKNIVYEGLGYAP